MTIAEHIISRKLSAARDVRSGYNNNVVGFNHQGTHYFAKIYREKGSFDREVYALEEFRRFDIPVPEIAFKSECFGESESCIVVTRAVDGTTLDKIKRRRSAYCYEVGRILSNIHAIKIPATIEPLVIPIEEIVEEVMKSAHDENISHPLLDALRETLEDLNRSDNIVLSHGDYIGRHIFVCRGAVSGIVDWECLRAARPELDLAHCSAFLEIFGEPEDDRQFIKGYGRAFDEKIDNRLRFYYKIIFAAYWKRLKKKSAYQKALNAIKTHLA